LDAGAGQKDAPAAFTSEGPALLPFEEGAGMVCVPAAVYDDDVRAVDADTAWDALWSGRWRVVDHVARSASHTIVCQLTYGPTSAPGPLLSLAQVQSAVQFARGVPVKAIGADSGRPTASIRKRLAEVKRKLMIQSDAQLVLLFGTTDRDDAVRRPAVLSAELTGFGPTERLHLHYAWPLPRLPAALSGTERAMVLDMIEGACREDLAASRGTSPRTVANQMASIFRKLQVHSRVELLVALLALGRQPALRRVDTMQAAAG
jgi:DNA-binding NarL/FixJ family response regulator